MKAGVPGFIMWKAFDARVIPIQFVSGILGNQPMKHVHDNAA